MDTFKFDPKKHVYTLDGKPLQGVTSVLAVIAKPALIGWSAKMAVEHVRENWTDGMTPTSHPEEWAAMLEEAQKAYSRKRDKAADKGTDIHESIEKIVKEAIADDGYIKKGHSDDPAVLEFVKWAIANKIKFIESEKRMYSRDWWVAGTADLVFEQDGRRYLGDIKTMKKLWDVTPFIQCAAYAKMLAEKGGTFDGTCIININKETNELNTHYRYDLEGDTRAFEAALTLYRTLKQ